MCPLGKDEEPERKSPVGDSGYRSKSVSPASDYSLSDVMRLTGNETGISSTIKLDLQPYIDTHNAHDEAGCEKYRDLFSEIIQGAGGGLFWIETLNAAMKKAVAESRLSAADCKLIENTPACEFMNSSFVEILKNVMDEAILGHYQAGRSAQIEMHINIDISSPDQITLTITDTGRGFPPAFIRKNKTEEGKEAYIMRGCGLVRMSEAPRIEDFVEVPKNQYIIADGGLWYFDYTENNLQKLEFLAEKSLPSLADELHLSEKRDATPQELSLITSYTGHTTKEAASQKAPSGDKTLPKLFGGAGLGLRILMAYVLRGDEYAGPGFLKPKYKKPNISKIELTNCDEGLGAKIQITTSRRPLEEKVVDEPKKDDSKPAAEPIKLAAPPPGRRRKNPDAPASTTAKKNPDAPASTTANEMKRAMADIRTAESETTEKKGPVPGQY